MIADRLRCQTLPAGGGARLLPAAFRAPLLAAALVALHLGCSSDESPSPPALAVDPAEIHLAQGDTTGIFEVRNAGQGTLDWDLSESVPWFEPEVREGSISGAQQVAFAVIRDSLSLGPHLAVIEFASNGGEARLLVEMWSELATEPDSLSLSGGASGAILLTNVGEEDLAWQAGTLATWLQVFPEAGVLGDAPETLSVSTDRTGLVPGSYEGRIWIDTGAFGQDTVVVRLEVPVTAAVWGFVHYTGTRIPVAGARVSAGGVADTTGPDGAYALADVPLGSQTLAAERAGFTGTPATVTVTTAGLERDLALQSELHTYRISGRLSNALDAGIELATITLLNPEGSHSDLTTRSRAGGLFELTGVPPGSREIKVTMLNYQSAVVTVPVEDADAVRDVRLVAAVPGPPQPVTGPIVARHDCTRVRVSWTPGLLASLATVAGYRVERATAAGGPYVDASGLVPGAATAAYDDEVFATERLYYRMRTETIDGDLSDPGAPVGFTLPRWVELHPTVMGPEERWGHSAVYDPNSGHPRQLILAGTGCTSGTCGVDFSDVWALDLETLAWELVDDGTGPADRNEHTSLLDESRRRVIVFGGKLGEGEQIYSDTWAFDLDQGGWTLLHGGQGAAPAARFSHVAVLDEAADRMIIHGGIGAALYNDVWSFDLAAQVWTRLRTGAHGELDPQPTGRYDHAAILDPGAQRMVIHGGLEAVTTSRAETWAFALGDLTWSRLPDGPNRCRHVLAHDAAHRRGVCFGGWRYGSGELPSGRFNDVWIFDLAANQWLELDGGDLEDRPEERDRHSMVLEPAGGAIYIFGGLLQISGLGGDAWTFCSEP